MNTPSDTISSCVVRPEFGSPNTEGKMNTQHTTKKAPPEQGFPQEAGATGLEPATSGVTGRTGRSETGANPPKRTAEQTVSSTSPDRRSGVVVRPQFGRRHLRIVNDSSAQDRAAARRAAAPAPIDRPRLMTLDQAAAELAAQMRGREVWHDLDEVTRQRYRHILSLLPGDGGAA